MSAAAAPSGGEAARHADIVRNGGEQMPPLAATLGPADVRDVAAYVADVLIKER